MVNNTHRKKLFLVLTVTIYIVFFTLKITPVSFIRNKERLMGGAKYEKRNHAQ